MAWRKLAPLFWAALLLAVPLMETPAQEEAAWQYRPYPLKHKTAQQTVCVFMPTTPNPTSGVLIFVPKEDLIYLDMTAEDGLKLVISGGVVAPSYPPEVASAPKELDKPE